MFESEWIKKTNAHHYDQERYDVIYERTNDNSIKVMIDRNEGFASIYCYVGKERIDEVYDHLAKKIKISPLPLFILNDEFICIKLSENLKNNFSTFLYEVDIYISIKTIKTDILKFLDVTFQKEEFLDELRGLIKIKHFNDARKKVDIMDHQELLFEYGLLLEEMDQCSEALAVYQDIPETNSAYTKANQRASEIILSYENNVNLSPEEKESCLESKVYFMLKAKNPAVDRHFAQWVGYGLSSDSIFPKIEMNEETIVNLGKEIKTLNKANQNLQQQNERLLQELAKLKAGMAAINRQVFFKNENTERVSSINGI